MFNIMRNTSKILFKRKSFLISTIILPVALILLFTLMYASNSNVKIGLINDDNGKFSEVVEERLNDIEGIEVKKFTKEDDIDQKLIFKEIELVVRIESGYTENLLSGEKAEIKINTITSGEIEPIVTSVVENETASLAKLSNNIEINDENIDAIIKKYNESKPSLNITNTEVNLNTITNSIGIIVYVIFIVAGLSCSFLLEDSRSGTKDRILMGNVSEKEYFGGLGLVFFILSSIPVFIYYVVNKIIGADFGFENTLLLIPLMLLLVILAISFNIMLSSIIKKKDVLNIVNSAFTIPMFMLSGSFWPFDFMSDSLQSVGNALPPRWFLIAVENLQQGNGIDSIWPMVLGLITVSALLFILSLFFNKHKIVLVKEN